MRLNLTAYEWLLENVHALTNGWPLKAQRLEYAFGILGECVLFKNWIDSVQGVADLVENLFRCVLVSQHFAGSFLQKWTYLVCACQKIQI